MKVSAIDNNDKRRSCIIPMLQGAGIGGVAGAISKYHPLTPQEKNDAEYLKVINRINKEKTQYSPQTEAFLKEIQSKPQRTLSEDVFVKMFDGMKYGDNVKKGTIKKAIETITEKDSNELINFKRLCKESKEIAEKTAEQCVKAYNLVTKHIRPTSFYIITGAIVGAFIALFKDVLTTDVKK